MKHVVNILRVELGCTILWAAILAALFETGLLEAGYYAGNGMAEYLIDLAAVVMMIVFVPFSLKLLSFRRIKAMFVDCDEAAACRIYRHWSEVRMALLAVMLWSDICFYYLTMDNTGLMCALVAVLGLCFCVPSVDKLIYETGWKAQDGGNVTDKKGKE